MNVKDILIEALKNPEPKNIAYIAKNSKNLDAVQQHAIENCDLTKAVAKIMLLHPIGVGKIIGELDAAYADRGSTSEEHLTKFLHLKENVKVCWVNADTQEIEECQTSEVTIQPTQSTD